MSLQHYKHFAAPDTLIAVDAGEGQRFNNLAKTFSDLVVFKWDSRKSNSVNFEELLSLAMGIERNQLLVAGCSVDQSCLIISLLALGRGFDVYVCGDLIEGPDDERSLLIERLRQHGAIIASIPQVQAEFEAVLDSEIGLAKN